MKTTLKLLALIALLVAVWLSLQDIHAQQPSPTPLPPPTLGLDQGYIEFDTPDFSGEAG